jgi:hypothetical protein
MLEISLAFNLYLYREYCYNFLALNLISYTSFNDVFEYFRYILCIVWAL